MKKRIFFLPICIFLGIHTIGQVQFKSLKEVFNYADANAYEIKDAEIQQNITKSKKIQSQSSLYPNISFGSGYNDNLTLMSTLIPAKIFNPNASEGTFEKMTFGKQHTYNIGLQAQWDILNFQKIFAAKAAGIQEESGLIQTEKIRYNLYNQLASTYYSILLAQKSIDIYNKNVEVSTKLLGNAKEKFNKGLISELELNKAKIQQLQNFKNLQNTKDNLQQLQVQLQSQLNLGEDIDINGDIEEALINNTDITTENPEILWQKSQIKAFEYNVKQGKALYYPLLSLQYQYTYNWATDGFLNFSNVSHLPSQVLGFKLSVPLFTGFNNKQSLNEMKLKLQQQKMKLDNLQLVKSKEDENFKLQYEQALNNLNRDKEILDLQEKNDLHYERRYENGIISLDDRLDKYNDLLTAQFNYLNSLADYSIAQYQVFIRQMNYQPSDYNNIQP
ncbi:TolC family protein [Apibacter muscae]|uniref:TolC family protein n=1 Tax=Apibacter muscae TaxID=2509004 RepID=A0A563DHX1_9FLAO|nr:TolC family protein [Apibacter muscae]TWP29866.1 TolC family protein [Apibacter muscae]